MSPLLIVLTAVLWIPMILFFAWPHLPKRAHKSADRHLGKVRL